MKEYTHYNRIKSVLAEKNKTGTWLSEQMGRNLGTVSRWMTNKVQPSVEQLYDIAKHLDVDVRDLSHLTIKRRKSLSTMAVVAVPLPTLGLSISRKIL